MSEQAQREQTGHRNVRVSCVGQNISELEMTALDRARVLFGEDAMLEVDRDYAVIDRPEKGDFFAAITVVCLTDGPL